MILKRYGSKIQSVTPNFDSRAMTEIGFVRNGEASMATEEFEEGYERIDGRELTAEATGQVQGHVEDEMLATLRTDLERLESGLAEGHVLVLENQQGVDHAKTKGSQSTIVVEGENRFVFQFTVDPPLRVGIYRRR